MINHCKLIKLPKCSDARGNLSFIEGEKHIPFDIKRVYYLDDAPGAYNRVSYPNKNLQKFIVARRGSIS